MGVQTDAESARWKLKLPIGHEPSAETDREKENEADFKMGRELKGMGTRNGEYEKDF